MGETTLKILKTIPFGNNKISIKFGTIEERLEEVLITRLNEAGIFFIQTDETEIFHFVQHFWFV